MIPVGNAVELKNWVSIGNAVRLGPFGVLDVRTLFAGGEQGLWLDIQNLANLYQDAAGTTPAAVGSPVGLIIDKSGNDNHLSQATSSQKPILRQDAGGNYYLEFDGVDDLLSVTFAAALGDCTVVYAGPDELTTLALNVGTEFQLHTGHCYGLLLIDRELTAAELGSTL
jgi:hypothetical protein